MFDLKIIKLGFFLGYRQFIRSSIWSNILIVLIMILTFLNLVVVSGLLVGIVEGAVEANKTHFSGDVIISTLRGKNNIENSHNIMANLDIIEGVEKYSARYTARGFAETGYQERTNFIESPEVVNTTIAGIDVLKEDAVTNLSDLLIEGEYLEPNDFDQVLIGAMLLRRFLDIDSELLSVLDDVYVGDKIRITIGNVRREVTVKGILKSKVDEIDRRIFMTDSQLKGIISSTDMNVNEISVILNDKKTPEQVKQILIDNGFEQNAKIQTFEDAQPRFLDDIRNTMSLLGLIIGSIGLVVASITIFIVIFINAITRRKYIGIMKGIGIKKEAIELSYIFQSLAYAIIGSAIGILALYFILVPYFNANPVNFPFSDGILSAPYNETFLRVGLLIITTAVAGYIPSRMIIKKNTLDSILGRK